MQAITANQEFWHGKHGRGTCTEPHVSEHEKILKRVEMVGVTQRTCYLDPSTYLTSLCNVAVDQSGGLESCGILPPLPVLPWRGGEVLNWTALVEYSCRWRLEKMQGLPVLMVAPREKAILQLHL